MKIIAKIFLNFIFIMLFVAFLISFFIKTNLYFFISQNDLNMESMLDFFGSILSFVGTITLGTISIWQTKKANNISGKVLRNSLINSTAIPQLQSKFNVEYKENKDTTITMPSHHKMDYGAIIAIEPFDDKAKKLNLYLMDFYFKCSGNANNIKEISIDNIMCVQDSSENGLHWQDNSNDPIPIELKVAFNNKAYLNWTDKDELFIQIKIYCESNKCFDCMIKDDNDVCIMFDATITNFNGIKTKMLYKAWLQNSNGICIIKTNSIITDNIEN